MFKNTFLFQASRCIVVFFQSYTKLKEALRVCAGFRGTYLDFKDKADDQNAKNIAENAERL